MSTPMTPMPVVQTMKDHLRFLSRFKVSDGCWEWKDRKVKDGYGQFKIKNTYYRAHRYSYFVFVGPIPDGLTIDHLCNNTSCVNPEHLKSATLRENLMRGGSLGAVNSRKTHCKYGHPFSEENTIYYERDGVPGRRRCRACFKRIGQLFRDRCSRGEARLGSKGHRKTHCPHGHPYNDTNMRLNKYGYMRCRACEKKYAAEYYLRKKQLSHLP